MSSDKNTKIPLYSEECLTLLRQAAEREEKAAQGTTTPSAQLPRYLDDSSSSSEEEEREESQSSESSSSSEEEETDNKSQDEAAAGELSASRNVETQERQPQKKKIKKKQPRDRQREQFIRQLGKPPCVSLAVEDDSIALDVPQSLLVGSDTTTQARSVLTISEEIGIREQPVVVMLLRSGRFAGGVFVNSKCLIHTSSQRYTVRRGQGKSQSSQDAAKKARSMGAQLRRAGEQNLREDVRNAVMQWSSHIRNASLILLSCPKTMKKGLFSDVEGVLSREDARIKRVPLDFGRPSFEAVCAVHEIMMTAHIVPKEGTDEEAGQQQPAAGSVEKAPSVQPAQQPVDKANKVTDQDKGTDDVMIPLTPLHEASRDGDLPAIMQLLDSYHDDDNAAVVNKVAGEMYMSPLHYAAASSQHVDASTAAACVSALLIQGHADPCLVDIRNRPPYFVASTDKVREAFRIARAHLGEEYCDWDADAKVGPPLTKEDIQNKKDKEAEKKRRKRAKQKEKKAKDKAAAEEAEQKRREEQQRRQQEEEAKRIRDGLQPKASNATNVCDYCQKVCKGKRRNQMLSRLDYVYCSTDCVQKHKRELMASAALSRLGP